MNLCMCFRSMASCTVRACIFTRASALMARPRILIVSPGRQLATSCRILGSGSASFSADLGHHHAPQGTEQLQVADMCMCNEGPYICMAAYPTAASHMMHVHVAVAVFEFVAGGHGAHAFHCSRAVCVPRREHDSTTSPDLHTAVHCCLDSSQTVRRGSIELVFHYLANWNLPRSDCQHTVVPHQPCRFVRTRAR